MEYALSHDDDGPPGEGLRESNLALRSEFDTGIETVYAVQDHALREGKSVKVESSSGKGRKVVCVADGCSVLVYLYRCKRADKTCGKWRLSSMELGHLNCSATAKPTKRQMIELATFTSVVRASGSVSASALVSQVQERDGISLGKHKRTVYRAREAVNEVAGKIVQRSVAKIPSLLAELERLNPGYTAVAE
ncbi:hypothetical protein PF007_g14275 [Phytophthora fragariae]|uniref:Transposase MuDR plant domain-containing protein n=1 Tax=Phytophthora fragariae TaxID=53985 RepID=A0A6A3RUA8_9STRA|nr:hypothetical protein PF003_g19822 [Phytophthora fragariae]KAE9103803.1 hypothetical protein PF007_g14275 [Phytophthora fragariae]